ncbi:hypothetical protein Enr10x_35140 [Gimesia panareensis]|uniref:Uncharacterized protein n=1 Tax=Gimesia panareensis TaxID=2527978 RepID=A0A518A8J6_9PLAN|nr:hypothetical protein Enr10x_35140 [Gimesia panareensis]QDU51042.1 hypothetical protein Pan110_34030 [Gimesia panareensis]
MMAEYSPNSFASDFISEQLSICFEIQMLSNLASCLRPFRVKEVWSNSCSFSFLLQEHQR